MFEIPELSFNVRTYCMLHLVIVLVQHLILAILVVYGEWGTYRLEVLCTWIYEHPYCTDGDI